MAKSGVIESHNLTAQGVLKLEGDEIYLTEIDGVGDVSLADLLFSFRDTDVKITVVRKTQYEKSEEN